MLKYEQQQDKGMVRSVWLAMVLLVVLGIAARVFCDTPAAREGGGDLIVQLKSEFDAAMAKPLNDRAPLLENLEQEIASRENLESFSPQVRAKGLYYKYHIQLQLAKYAQAYETYAKHIKAIKDCSNAKQAHAVLLRKFDKLKKEKRYTDCSQIGKSMMESFSDDPDISSASLFYMAWSQYYMNGTMKHCLENCNKLISNYPDSPYRADAMRLLARALTASGKHDDAISTLGLLKNQYPNTKFEHYADMKIASIYEFGKGNPQKALEVYQSSLKRYHDHFYAVYIRRQIERLHKIIEEKLIQDALEGIATTKAHKCRTKSTVATSENNKSPQLVHNSFHHSLNLN